MKGRNKTGEEQESIERERERERDVDSRGDWREREINWLSIN
jgi:hypothetical protein